MATKKESLYVVNQFGRDHFIWAESAAEARAKAEQPVVLHSFEAPLLAGQTKISLAGL